MCVRGVRGSEKACLKRCYLNQDLENCNALPLWGYNHKHRRGASQEEDRDQPVLQTPFLLRLREGSEVPKATQHNGSQAERELELSQDPSPHSCCPSLGHCQGPGQDSLAISWTAWGLG